MKILLSLCSFGLIFASTTAKCGRGILDSFILSTNVAHPPSSYKTIPDTSLVECTRACLNDNICHFFSFLRNGNETECRLTRNLASDAKKRLETSLPPTTGTYYMEKVCLKGACDRLFVAESVRGSELLDHNDATVANSSRLSCLEACLTHQGFACRSVEFDPSTSECRLSRHDRFGRRSHFVRAASPSVEYFDVTCHNQQPASEASEIIPLGSVEHPYTLVEYEGVSEEECGELCRRSPLFPCRSFLWGQRQGVLYCGLSHRNREALGSAMQATRSLSYYEMTGSIEGCDSSDLHFELVSGMVLTAAEPFSVTSDIPPKECLGRCKGDSRCRAIAIDYRKGACRYYAAGGDNLLEADGNFDYYEKVCLPGTKCNRSWCFERIRNKELVGIDHEKALVEAASTKEECQIACLNHKEFTCYSAEFNYQLNECRLSPYNRFSSTEKGVSVSHSRFVVDYMENNCVEEPRGFCNTKLIKKQRLMLTEQIAIGESIEDCRQQCYAVTDFVCRSVTFDPRLKTCGMSHHTRRTAPQDSIGRSNEHEFLEVSTCFEISVDCRQDIMMAHVKSNALFKGKVYAKGKPLTCSTDINNSLEFDLPISLNGADCGTISEEEGKFNNVLVIQSNDHVVTAMDKAIGIHCSYDVGNKTEEVDIKITDPGSSDRSRGSPSLPDLSLHIVDMKGEERETVALGELLRVQVRMSDEDTYGIFVRNLVAKDGSGYNNLTLIDNTGCPVEVKMMREVRTIEPQSKSLEGYLEAFTFTGSSTLELEAEVETCLENCKPVLCQIPTGRREDDTETVSSFGRKKRDTSFTEDILSTVTLSRSVAVQAQDFEAARSFQTENYASPVTAPPSLVDAKGSGLFHRFGPPSVGSSESTFCFDPTLFALIGGGFFLAEVCGFSACLVAAFKWRRNNSKALAANKKRHLSIHYENSTEGS